MSIINRIEQLITPALVEKGFEVVHIDLQGGKKKTLQIMIERQDREPLSTDDCVIASHLVSLLLDVEDPISEPYVLEMSSPGPDRPLKTKQDFERFAGDTIKLELKTPYQGARRLQGVLRGIKDDLVQMDLPSSPKDDNFAVAELAFSDIQKAKIVPNYDA